MAELNHKKFESYIEGLEKDTVAPVYLVYGEEYLVKTAFDALLDKLVPESKRSFGYEPADEDTENMADIIERLNTFSMLAGSKIVSLCDSKLFHSKQDLAELWKKCKSDYDNENKKKASGYLHSIMTFSGVSAEEARSEKGKEDLNYGESFDDDGAWVDDLLDFLSENPLKSKGVSDPMKLLCDAIEKGFPKKHHLVITTDIVDKRKKLYTVIKDTGMVIDCSVPQGERKADKDVKDAILRESLGRVLAQSGKTLDPDAYRYMCDMTGFDLRTFMGNLEKLVTYCNERPRITCADARDLLRRTKQDPIYELSGAVAERNLGNALFYTKSLMKNDVYPLQILRTIVNQLRRLILAKDFLMSLPRERFRGVPDYNGFRSQMMPMIITYDQTMKERVMERETKLNEQSEDGKAAKKVKGDTDLILAKTPNNPYPVYLLMTHANRFGMTELMDAYTQAQKADVRLKSTGEDPKLILEDLLITILKPLEKRSS